MAGRISRKFASLAFTWMFMAAFWLPPATSLTPTFDIYAKNGTPINNHRMVYLLDPDSSVRIGFKVCPDMRIGFDSKHGLGIVSDF